MKFNVELNFYKKDQNSSDWDIGDQINFSNIPSPIQKKIIEVIKNSIKFKNYLEKNISNMGSACKDNLSHYLQLKINKIKPIITKSFFGKKSVILEISATFNQIQKKIKGEQWCLKTLSQNEIKNLFSEDNLIKHMDWALKELMKGDPFKKFTDKKIKYYFYYKSVY